MNNFFRKTLCLILAGALFITTGCASYAPPEVSSASQSLDTPTNHGLVYILRPWRFRAGAGPVYVSANNNFIGAVSTDQFLVFYADSGSLAIGESLTDKRFVLDVKKGHRHYVELAFNMHINPISAPSYRVLSQDEGERLLIDYSLSGNNPLHYLCRTLNVELVKSLYTERLKSLSTDQQFADNVQCLIEAASAGNLEIIDWMTSLNFPLGSYVTYSDKSNGSTPIKAALDGKNYEVTKFLIEHGAPTFIVTEEYSYSALDEAAKQNDMEDVEFLLRNGADPNLYIRGETPLVTAIRLENNALSKFLIQNGAFVSYNQDFLSDPLETSRQTGNTEMESYLLQMGAIDKRVIREREKMLAEMRKRQALDATLDVISNIAIVALGVAVGVSAANYKRPPQEPSSFNNREIQRQQDEILRLQKLQQQQLTKPIRCKSDLNFFGTVDTKCQRGY